MVKNLEAHISTNRSNAKTNNNQSHSRDINQPKGIQIPELKPSRIQPSRSKKLIGPPHVSSRPQPMHPIPLEPLAPVHFAELRAAWEADRRIPTVSSRRAWSLARNVNVIRVNSWWNRQRAKAKKTSASFSNETYDMDVGTPPVVVPLSIKKEEEVVKLELKFQSTHARKRSKPEPQVGDTEKSNSEQPFVSPLLHLESPTPSCDHRLTVQNPDPDGLNLCSSSDTAFSSPSPCNATKSSLEHMSSPPFSFSLGKSESLPPLDERMVVSVTHSISEPEPQTDDNVPTVPASSLPATPCLDQHIATTSLTRGDSPGERAKQDQSSVFCLSARKPLDQGSTTHTVTDAPSPCSCSLCSAEPDLVYEATSYPTSHSLLSLFPSASPTSLSLPPPYPFTIMRTDSPTPLQLSALPFLYRTPDLFRVAIDTPPSACLTMDGFTFSYDGFLINPSPTSGVDKNDDNSMYTSGSSDSEAVVFTKDLNSLPFLQTDSLAMDVGDCH